jgi:hypothetical protein
MQDGFKNVLGRMRILEVKCLSAKASDNFT